MPWTVAYYGHHRCASNMTINALERICAHAGIETVIQDHAMKFPSETDLPKHSTRNRMLLCWNSDVLYVRELELSAFHVIRDPRDVIVSGYFAHLHSHPDENWPRLRAFRRYLATLDESEGLMAEMEFSSIYLHQMLAWDYDNPLILEMRFEDLIEDPAAHLEAALVHVGLTPAPVPAKLIRDVVDSFAFEKVTGGRRPGEENVRHHFRKGVAGDWKNHFTERHITRFKELYNPVLLKTGYETDANW